MSHTIVSVRLRKQPRAVSPVSVRQDHPTRPAPVAEAGQGAAATRRAGEGAAWAATLPHVAFHGLGHTHITHLLRSGVPVHVVSERAGHASPTVTLNIYGPFSPAGRGRRGGG